MAQATRPSRSRGNSTGKGRRSSSTGKGRRSSAKAPARAPPSASGGRAKAIASRRGKDADSERSARRKKPVRPGKSHSRGTPAAPSAERVEAALIHLAELAVAQRGGIEFVEIDAGEDLTRERRSAPDPYAAGCLNAVVKRLEAHRQRQVKRLVEVHSAKLFDALKPVYTRLQKDPDSVDLDAAVESIIGALGFQLHEQDLLEFVIDNLDLRKTDLRGQERKGPSEVAAAAVAARIGIEPREVYYRRAAALALVACRLAWNRWIPLRLARRYAVNVFDDAIARRKRDTEQKPTLDDLVALRGNALAMLEQRAEDEYGGYVRATYSYAFLSVLAESDLDRLVPEHRQKYAVFLERFRDQREELVRVVERVVRMNRKIASVEDEPSVEPEVQVEYQRLVEDLIEKELVKLGIA